ATETPAQKEEKTKKVVNNESESETMNDNIEKTKEESPHAHDMDGTDSSDHKDLTEENFEMDEEQNEHDTDDATALP
ncbi:hypothetical protein RFI_08952, partial [Reticulomyxa filosa]